MVPKIIIKKKALSILTHIIGNKGGNGPHMSVEPEPIS